MRGKLKLFSKVLIAGGIFYFILHLPLFFLYPNYKMPLRKNIDDAFFHTLAASLSGDCERVAKNFIRECPFPAREVHLNSEHTIVEIKINKKWYAYDPYYQRFFNNKNVVQIAYDVNRNYIGTSLDDYPYAHSFKNFDYYHNLYFVVLNKLSPRYHKVVLSYYPFK
jgi:hypothetical protein